MQGDRLNPLTRLVVAAGVTVRLEGVRVSVARGKTCIEAGGYALAVLDAFRWPRPFAEGLSLVVARTGSATEGARVVREVAGLVDAGILVDESGRSMAVSHGEGSFDALDVHLRMLDDRRRTDAFRTAIRRLVQPGDVVIDAGTGTGVLAAFAAQAGARHVYACERTAIARLARTLVTGNGLDSSVTVVESDIQSLTLPERADVLICETIGDDPLGEGVLPIAIDVRHRLLKPNARLIPRGIAIEVLPVTLPPAERDASRVTADRLRRWEADYGLRFDALRDADLTTARRIKRRPSAVARWPRLGPPVRVADLDLGTVESPVVEGEATLVVSRRGTLSGLFLYFVADLGSGISLSQHPDEATRTDHWPQLLFVLPSPRDVAPNDRIQLSYRHDDTGSSVTITDI